MIDSYGNVVPNSEVICDEKERARLQRLLNQRRGHAVGSAALKRLSRRRDSSGCGAVIKRLLKQRERIEEQDLRKTEVGRGTAASEQSKRDISDSRSLKKNTNWRQISDK